MKFIHAIAINMALHISVLAYPARAAASETMEYDITWVGISVGTMSIRSQTAEDGILRRTLRIWNRPWIALVYPVDTTIDATIEPTPDGPRHTIVKKISEHKFVQNDTLVLMPDAGKAVWSNAVSNVVYAFEVPRNSKDLVTLFFDLRDAAGDGPLKAGGEYRLVMDNGIHAFEIAVSPPKSIRTPYGRMHALPVKAVSKSPVLFSRNTPRSIWVVGSPPVVLFADVETRFGSVRGTLVKWEVDGKPVDLATLGRIR